MAEWSIAAVLKTVEVNSLPGFESLSLRKNQKASQQSCGAFFCSQAVQACLQKACYKKAQSATLVADAFSLLLQGPPRRVERECVGDSRAKSLRRAERECVGDSRAKSLWRVEREWRSLNPEWQGNA